MADTMIADYKIAAGSRTGGRPIWMGRVPSIVLAVLASRLLILASGVAGGVMHRVQGWEAMDPTRLTTGFGALGNLLLSGSVRWDSIHYLSIAEHGYKPAADTQFFPFYPLLIHALSWIVGSDVAAGLLLSAASFAVALTLLHRLVRDELGERVATATVLVLAFAPLSLFFTAIYTESLNLALAVGTFYLARRGHLRWACLTAACATLTHIEGIALWPALAFMFWEARGRHLKASDIRSWDGAALLLPPVALLGLLLYMHAIGFPWMAVINGANPTGHGYSVAPISAANHAPHDFARSLDGPAVTIWLAVTSGLSGLVATLRGAVPVAPGLGNVFTVGFQNLVYLVVLAITLTALVAVWRWRQRAYAIYATLVVLLYTMSAVTPIPLRAFDRYMLPLFPLWIVTARWLEERRLLSVALTIGSLFLAFYTVEFSRWAMVA